MARRNRYYTNLSYVDEGLRRKNKESQAAMAPGMHMQVGSNQVRPSDMVRMASLAAPFVGGALGAGVGGLGGWLAGGPATAGAGAVGGLGVGVGLGQAAGGMGAGWADQMEKEQEEEQARLAAQRAALMSLV